MMSLPYAQDVNYWKTGRSDSMAVLQKAADQLAEVNGTIETQVFGMHNGQEAIIFGFKIDGTAYRINWPVLPSKRPDEDDHIDRHRQAAAFVFHDVKARCMTAKVLGARRAFVGYLVDRKTGQTVAELANPFETDQLRLGHETAN